MKKYGMLILLLISSILLTIYLKVSTEENKNEVSNVSQILEKPAGIQAYTYLGEETTQIYDYLIKNKLVDSITCKNGTVASYNYEDNTVILTNIKIPDYCVMDFKEGYTVSLTAGSTGTVSPASQTIGYNGSVSFTVTPSDGYKAELSTNTCGGTLSGTTYTISNVTSNKSCSITFKKSGSALATLIKSLVVTSGQGVYNENGYRYEGSDPNNYIKMKKSDGTYEMWRIIGVFNDGTSSEEVVRVRRYYTQGNYPTMAYDTNKTNHWPNTTMYASLSSTYSLANYANTVNFKMYLGAGTASTYNSFTSAGLYYMERGSTAGATSSSSYSSSLSHIGPFGLMYPSDYGYGVLASDCARTIYLYKYNETSACYNNNWLFQGSSTQQWLISPSAVYAYAEFYVYSTGYVNFSAVNSPTNAGAFSPVMALSASTTVTGSGTYSDPYVVS